MASIITPEIKKKLVGMLRDGGASIERLCETFGMTPSEVRIAKRGPGPETTQLELQLAQAESAVRKGRLDEQEAVEYLCHQWGVEVPQEAPVKIAKIDRVTLTKSDNGNFGSLATSQNALTGNQSENTRMSVHNRIRAYEHTHDRFEGENADLTDEEWWRARLAKEPPTATIRTDLKLLGIPHATYAESFGFEGEVERTETSATEMVITTTAPDAEQAQAEAEAERAARDLMAAQNALNAALRRVGDLGGTPSTDTMKMAKGAARKSRGLLSNPAARRARDAGMRQKIEDQEREAVAKARRERAEKAAFDQRVDLRVAKIHGDEVDARLHAIEAGRLHNSKLDRVLGRADAQRDFVKNAGRHGEQWLVILKRTVELFPSEMDGFDPDNMTPEQRRCVARVQKERL